MADSSEMDKFHKMRDLMARIEKFDGPVRLALPFLHLYRWMILQGDYERANECIDDAENMARMAISDPEYAQDYYDFLIRGALETTNEPNRDNNIVNNEHLKAPYIEISKTENERKSMLPIGGKKKAMWKEKERRRKQKKQLKESREKTVRGGGKGKEIRREQESNRRTKPEVEKELRQQVEQEDNASEVMEPLQDCEADQDVYKKEEQKVEQVEACEDRQQETKISPPEDVIPYPIQRIDSTLDQPKEETKVIDDEAKPLQTDLVGASLIEETLLETNPVIDPPVATIESIESQLGLGPPTKCEISSLEMRDSADESDVQVKNDPDIIAKEVEVLTDPDDEAFREPQMKANSQIETSLESKAKETKTDLEVEVPAELQAEVAELLRYHSTKSGGEMTSLKDIIDLDDTPVSKIEEGQNHAAKSKKIGVEEEGDNDDDGNRETRGKIIQQ